ncbi:Exocyst complex component 6B [Liparis tanakae]|uniref:Exocyst complex component 6B n=1 Tax=Liparis tanakae TaxID=230148 RepID=A0A4Z2EU70_9TELE|nr:Exocyst complex component 6B [Liparis tanakae]
MIRKSTNLLLTRTLSHCLQYAIKKKNVGLAEDARHAAEAEIYTNINAKIDQFLQLADYDWMAPVPGGGTPEASDYLIDLIAFLKSTFSVFTNLPGFMENPPRVPHEDCNSSDGYIQSQSLLTRATKTSVLRKHVLKSLRIVPH